MSIAELIMTGTERASKSTDWVADSLAKIGDNVSKVLREREQKKQAQEMLPYLQQSMQESMKLAQDGDTAGAYSNMMGVLASNPNLMNNQAALPFIKIALQGLDESAKTYKQTQDYDQRQAYYNGVLANKTGSGGGGGIPAGPSAFFNQNPADTEPLPTNPTFTQPVDEMPQGAGGAMPGFTGQFAAGLNEPVQNQGPIEPSPEVQKSFENNEKAYSNATPQQQQTYQNNLSSTTIPQGTNVTQFDFSNIKSLRNVVGIASPVEMQIEVPESLSITENDKGKSYLTKFNKKTTNQNVIDKSNELVLKSVPNALAGISSNETLSKYFEENDLGKLDIGAKKEDGELSYYIGVRGKKDSYIEITEPDYENAKMIRNLPSSAKTLDSAFIITQEPTAEAPAATQGGLPATQQVTPEIPDAKGNPFAEKIKKIQTTETEKNKNAVKEEIDFVVKTASRLSEALTGLSKGEYPKTLEYLPRAKQEALKGSSLENLRTEYNTLAGLKEAIDYIKNNPNTPEAAQAVKVIKQKLGI